jgi:signal peptidase I
MMEFDIKAVRGSGSVLFGITDGHDRFIAEIPVSQDNSGTEGTALLRAGLNPFFEGRRRPDTAGQVYRRALAFRLKPGRKYHVEMAFVDRRLSLAIDGSTPFEPVDLPPVEGRRPVVRPVKLGVRGVKATISNFRLFRDIHYTESGVNAVHDVVSLGPTEYFVLGDNSPNSDDSRFWKNRGAVSERSLIGKPFLAHWPSRVGSWKESGGRRELQLTLDWDRLRWLR